MKRFLQSVLPGVLKPVRVLWNEVIAFVFLVLGLLMIPYIWRGIESFQTNQSSPGRLILASFFCLTMLYFAATSYWRARKIGRS